MWDYIIPAAIVMVICAGIGLLLAVLFSSEWMSFDEPLWLEEFSVVVVFVILMATGIVSCVIAQLGKDGEKPEGRSGIFGGPRPQLLLWLVVFPVAVAGTGVYYYFEGPSSDLELRPGEERCVNQQLTTFRSGDWGCSPYTYEVTSVEKPDFLDYRTKKTVTGAWCNVNVSKVDVTACVRASPSAPAGTYKVEAGYRFSDGWGSCRVNLIVKVLSSQ